ncbi:MAG: nucleotidyltransferase family protein [Proteobacteria bacterium]|nr:nucleotidyltransferase family protein [Pseudomonadota bacterium]
MSAPPTCAMIMAAGLGTRMLPLTATRPKPLVSVAGTTLLDHVLGHLRAAGVGRIVVNVHYLPEQIEAHLAAHAGDFAVAVSDERALLRDTGGGLVQALPLIEGDPFYCVNADNWWTDAGAPALTRMAHAWDPARMDALLLLVPREAAGNHLGQGDFDLDAVGQISRAGGKRARPFVWTGVQLLARHLIVDPPAEVFSTNVFWDRAIAAGRACGLVHQGAWFDVGYPAAIGLTEAALSRG